MKIGLKLWSINTDYYYNEAIRLYNKGVYDYIELYVVPNTTETLEKWGKLDVPFALHAPHYAHKVNLADPESFEYNKVIYNQVERFRQMLNAQYTIVHSGTEGSIEEVIRQLNIINPQNILIENKPYRAPLGNKELCRGYNVEEIKKVIDNTGCKFCLDISHAICTANSIKEDPYIYVEKFNKLNPECYHISDGYADSEIDMHLNIGTGNFDFKKIFGIINSEKNIAIETKKSSKTNLNDFIKDIKIIREQNVRKR